MLNTGKDTRVDIMLARFAGESGTDVLHALCAIADYLDEHRAPIDYQARRDGGASMITLVDIEVVGRTKRELDRPRKRDRLAAVRYGRARMNPYRRPPRPGAVGVDPHGDLGVRHGRFIGASVQDTEADLRLLPHERPGLVRLGALATPPLPGGVLIESLNDLDTPGDRPLARAVLGRYLQKNNTSQDSPLWHGQKWRRNNTAQVRQVTAKEIDSWVHQAGRSATKDELDLFQQTVLEYLAGTIHEDHTWAFFSDLGTGPLRDTDLARQEYLRLTGSNSDADITRYLETYGYINPAGTVGRWYHKQLKSLHGNRSTI